MATSSVEDKLSKSLDELIKEESPSSGGSAGTGGGFRVRVGRGGGFRGRGRFGGVRGRGPAFRGGGGGRFGDGGRDHNFVRGGFAGGGGQHFGGRGRVDPSVIFMHYSWSHGEGGEEIFNVRVKNTDIVQVISTGEVCLNSGGFRNSFTLRGQNAVLAPLGIKVEEGEGGEWVVKKGTWTQGFQDHMKISAFAKRDYVIVRQALTNLPPEIREGMILPGPVLGKRDAGQLEAASFPPAPMYYLQAPPHYPPPPPFQVYPHPAPHAIMGGGGGPGGPFGGPIRGGGMGYYRGGAKRGRAGY